MQEWANDLGRKLWKDTFANMLLSRVAACAD
jgi:hypothetical protein